MNVPTRDLLRLLEVANTESISQAAKNLRIAQPALSKTIRYVEERFGFPLFVRTHRGVKPTDQARVVFSRLLAVKGQLDRLEEDVLAIRSNAPKEVIIGVDPMHPIEIVSAGMLDFSRRHPELRIHMKAHQMSELLEVIQKGKIDFAFGALPERLPYPGLVTEVIYYEEVVIACGPASPLYKARAIRPADLSRQSWVVGPDGTNSRRLLDEMTRALELPPCHVPILSDSTQARIQYVQKSSLLSLFQRAPIRSQELEKKLRVLPVTWPCAPSVIGTLRPETCNTAIHRSYVAAMRKAFADAGLVTRGPDAEGASSRR